MGAVLLGLVAEPTGDLAWALPAGVVLGDLMGYGAEMGVIGIGTFLASILAIAFMLLARGYDDWSGWAAIPGAVLGALIGRSWQGMGHRRKG
ncbi:MAG: hypothetical protein U0800_08300 [Isosphaeraceae bacterium]